MKEMNIHEGCIEQIQRLFAERLYTGGAIPLDEKGRIRVDDWEMREDVQAKVSKLWEEATTETFPQIGDLTGYKNDFLNLFGFGFEGIDYTKDVNENLHIDTIQ
jgi:enoyl-[acyl-carrier protein] reductase/trans-2-enoyl-CoA reductase (NAD+)